MRKLLVQERVHVPTSDDYSPATSGLTALGCHVYAGGFALGVGRHFSILAHLEREGYGKTVIEANWNNDKLPKIPVYTGSRQDWPIDEGDEHIGRLRQHLAKRGVDLVFGNPPCAPFSNHGNRGADYRIDPRVQDINSLADVAFSLKPKVWCWESVGSVLTRGRDFAIDLGFRAMEAGYTVSHVKVDAQAIGVAQRRRRYFFVAHKVAIDWTKSFTTTEPMMVGDVLHAADQMEIDQTPYESNHVPAPEWASYMEPGRTLRDAFFAAVEDGALEPEIKEDGKMKGAPFNINRRLHRDRVAPTFVAGTWYHPDDPLRSISWHEYLALLGFPQDFEVPGWERGGTEAMKLLARGVLPYVADWLAGTLASAIEENKPTEAPRQHLIEVGPYGAKDTQVRDVKQLELQLGLEALPDTD